MNQTLASQKSSNSPCQAIDFSKFFMPEELTSLYYTPAYASLREPQRRRYNQLNALYFNEQTMFFERALARNVLGYFLGKPLPDALKAGLFQFMAQEGQHSDMFLALNRKCAPDIYRHADFHFIRVPRLAAKILDFISQRPTAFPFLLWLMHLQEERAMSFGRAFLKCADSLEPQFVAVQRKHLADEIGHVRWDEDLLDRVWPRTGPLLRHINIRAFAWLINEYFSTPKRSAMRVVSALVREFPELRSQQHEISRQLRSLGENPEYRRSLYCPENVPKTFKRFDASPEFRSLIGAMPGYIPGTNA